MLMAEPSTAVRFSSTASARFDSSTTSRRLSHSTRLFMPWNKFQRLADGSCMRRNSFVKNRVRASAEEQSGAASSPIKPNAKPSRYHPFEDIVESELMEAGDARLTPAEITRTIIEVKNDEDILKTLSAEDNLVQVIIGLDTAELLSEMELAGSSEIDFGIEEIDDEDSDVEDNDDDDDDDDDDDEDEDEDEDEDDNYDGEWVSILEDEEDQEDSDESLGDWAKLETMRFSHPMYFAKKMSEVASDDPIDFMDQPPAGLAVQGLLRPAFIEEHSVIQKHISESNDQSGDNNSDQIERSVEDKVEDIGIINGHRHGPGSAQDSDIWAEELEKGESVINGTSFYKLEMIKIQLISAHGHQGEPHRS